MQIRGSEKHLKAYRFDKMFNVRLNVRIIELINVICVNYSICCVKSQKKYVKYVYFKPFFFLNFNCKEV